MPAIHSVQSSTSQINFTPVSNRKTGKNSKVELVATPLPIVQESPPAQPSSTNTPTFTPKGWHERAIIYLKDTQSKIDEIPNLPFQNNYDALVKSIEEKFKFLNGFNAWLDANDEGAWYKQLAMFLAKLPLRPARNIIHYFYKLIKEIFSFAVHPLDGMLKIARLMVDLIHALIQPETWSRLGAGIVGFSLGAGLGSGNPFSVPGLVIGSIMAAFGISFGVFKAAVEHAQNKKMEAIKKTLINQSIEIPEAILTGFLLGLIGGGMQGKTKVPKMTMNVE